MTNGNEPILQLDAAYPGHPDVCNDTRNILRPARGQKRFRRCKVDGGKSQRSQQPADPAPDRAWPTQDRPAQIMASLPLTSLMSGTQLIGESYPLSERTTTTIAIVDDDLALVIGFIGLDRLLKLEVKPNHRSASQRRQKNLKILAILPAVG